MSDPGCMSIAVYREKAGWIPEPSEVPGLLAAQYGWVHGMSVTEMEIIHGAYRTATANGLVMVNYLCV